MNSHGRVDAPFRFKQGDTCCYGPAAPGFHWRGRALRGPGGVALAAVIARAGWAADSELAIDALSAETRAALAEVWLRDAAFEHASVASFARLSLDLIALGAPASLVAAAHRAALDEIVHAELAFGIASRLAGRSLGPAPLDTTPAAPVTLESLARDCFRDGCYGETVAVMLAHASIEATRDPILRAAYERIAEDEQRHAELAFQIVAWAIEHSPQARDAIAGERATLAATVAPAADEPGDDFTPFGVLDGTAEAAVRERTVHELVLPCIDAMLARAMLERASALAYG